MLAKSLLCLRAVEKPFIANAPKRGLKTSFSGYFVVLEGSAGDQYSLCPILLPIAGESIFVLFRTLAMLLIQLRTVGL
jgi:hypothetical protein